MNKMSLVVPIFLAVVISFAPVSNAASECEDSANVMLRLDAIESLSAQRANPQLNRELIECVKPVIFNLVENGETGIVSRLFKIGLTKEDMGQSESQNPLCLAVQSRDSAMVELLLDHGFQVDVECGSRGPIMKAAWNFDQEIVRALLDKVERKLVLDWNLLFDLFSSSHFGASDNEFVEHLKNERNRIEASTGLKSGRVQAGYCIPASGTFLELILCSGHGFIRTNVAFWEKPELTSKKYDNSTGILLELESRNFDEYIGFYPHVPEVMGVQPDLGQEMLRGFQNGLQNIGPAQATLMGAENAMTSGVYCFFPKGFTSRVNSALWSGFSTINPFFSTFHSPLDAILMDEQRFYDEEKLKTCQRTFLPLSDEQAQKLAAFLSKAKEDVSNGKMRYDLYYTNCVDFVRAAHRSVSTDKDLVDRFAGTNPLQVRGRSGFSVTAAWAIFQDKGLWALLRTFSK